MIKQLGIWAASLLVLVSMAKAQEEKPMAKQSTMWMYVGSRSAKPAGIYRAKFDTSSGGIGKFEPVTDATSGSFMVLSSNGKRMFTVGDVKGAGSVSSFDIDSASGELGLIDQQASGSKGPCHLAVDEKGGHVIVANYSGGAVTALPVSSDGHLSEASDVVQREGKGPNTKRQEQAHPHCTTLDSKANRVAVADLGTDHVMLYTLPGSDGKLVGQQSLKVAPGTGPRHVAFSKDGRFLYVLGELISTVTVFRRDGESFKQIQVIGTLPEDYKGINWPSEIEIQPSGKFLYASNRTHDSMAMFEIDPGSGKLTSKGQIPTQGKHPRHFKIDPAGKFLVVANQDSDNLLVYRIDESSGGLTPVGEPVKAPGPMCVLFVP